MNKLLSFDTVTRGPLIDNEFLLSNSYQTNPADQSAFIDYKVSLGFFLMPKSFW